VVLALAVLSSQSGAALAQGYPQAQAPHGMGASGYSYTAPQAAPPQAAAGSIPNVVGSDQPLPGQDPRLLDPRDPRRGISPLRPHGSDPSELKGPDVTDFRLYARRDSAEVTEFQEFVFQSTGRLLKIFGQDLFDGAAPSTFEPLDRVPVTSDYLVGPGDELVIRGWGQVNIDYRAVVDREGSINIRGVGTVSLAGVAFRDLEQVLRRAIGRVYQNFELSVTMGRLRAVQVFVVGQARRPGSYTVSSLSTVVNALFAAGGPSPRGSMRSVQLKRGGKTVAEFDLYDLIVRGDKSKDARLLPGDVIYVPPVGELVAVAGSVNNPAIYEIRSGESLEGVLGIAGGLSNVAEGRRVSLERIAGRSSRVVEEVALEGEGLKRKMRGGDLVRVLAVLPKIDNAVTLKGAVARPGRYAWREGMRVRDLIPGAAALGSAQAWMRRNNVLREAEAGSLRRSRVEDSRLQDLADQGLEQDLLARRATQRALLAENTSSNTNSNIGPGAGVAGQMNPDGSFGPRSYRPNATVPVDRSRWRSRQLDAVEEWRPISDAINWDYAAIERLNPTTLETQLIPFNLGLAVLKEEPTHNLALRPGDVITVFALSEIVSPISRQTKFVKLEGELVTPGIYQILQGETLRQLVTRVGGLTRAAYTRGAEFTRERTRETQQRRLDEAADRLEAEIRRVSAAGGASKESADTARAQSEGMLQLAAKLREVRATGRIVLDGVDGPLQDIALEDGDRLYVPSRPSTVSVVGAVYNQNAFVYRDGQSLDDYLGKAGGTTAFGDADSLYVIKADGSVVGKKSSGWFSALAGGGFKEILPGDTIVVPENIDRYRFTRELKDWSQILYQFALGAAAWKVLQQ
jgi:polysaccharide export outer membrane protein